MRSLISMVVVGAVALAGYAYKQGFRVTGLENLGLEKNGKQVEVGHGGLPGGLGGLGGLGGAMDSIPPPVERTVGTIRVGSYNIQVFGTTKLANPRVMGILAEVVRRFDIVAIQEVRAKSDDILPRFVELINSTGRKYDFAIGPRLGRTASTEQYAFIFDTASIEMDRHSLYTIEDPDDLLHREPLVGWFRVRGPAPEQAFTFSLVDIHTDPDDVPREVNALASAFRAVRDDGRNEDDVILLGDLNADDRHFGALGQLPQIAWAISGVPSNTRGDKLYDNIIFSRTATAEYTGRGGVFDIIREFNITVEEALQVSDHMPIWAEFSIYEGGRPGQVAAQPGAPTAR